MLKSLIISDRCRDGKLIIFTSQSGSVFVMPCMQPVVQRMQANLFWKWYIAVTKRSIRANYTRNGFLVNQYCIHLCSMHSTFSAGFTQLCLSAPESDGDVVSTPTQDANVATVHANPTPLLREWAKAKLVHNSWKDALLSAVGVSIFFCSRAYGSPDVLVPRLLHF